MEWIIEKGGFFGRITKLPERNGENGTATHIILSTKEYDSIQEKIKDLENEIQKSKNSVKSTKAEYTKMSNKLKKETEELRKKIDADAAEKIMEANLRRDEQESLNRNLLRINKERSNAQRGLSPVKKHSGYVVMQSRQVDIRLITNKEAIIDTVWETTIQTPYGVEFPLEQVDRLIDDDLFSGIWKVSEIGIESIYIEEYSNLISIWEESKEEIKNTIFKQSYRLNMRSGYWDVIYVHNKPLIGVPKDMRP